MWIEKALSGIKLNDEKVEIHEGDLFKSDTVLTMQYKLI